MLTTDRGQTISITDNGIQITPSEGGTPQFIDFDDIRNIEIVNGNVLEITAGDNLVMDYKITDTDNVQEFKNSFNIARLQHGKKQKVQGNTASDSASDTASDTIPLADAEAESGSADSRTVHSSDGQIHIDISQTTSAPHVSVHVGKRRVKKVAYCLWAFFLGGLGAHKFYEGKYLMGFIYLLFCWTGIPAVIALVEFIIAICKTSDEEGYIYL